jgi:Ca2+-binding RTX toxin-like protein
MFKGVMSTAVAAAGLIVLATAGGAGAEAAKKAKPKCDGLKATIVAKGSDDAVYGTNKPDVIVTKPSVTAYGRGDDDVICGAQEENAQLIGGSGDDTLVGGPVGDQMIGGSGDDWLRSTGGDGAFLIAGSGDDTLDGSDDIDTCRAGTGDDSMTNCDTIDDPDA